MESQKSQSTCDERIDEELNRRLDQLLPDVQSWGILECARHLKAEGRAIPTANLDTLHEEVRSVVHERAWESILSIEHVTTYKLCLSWGGPADYFEFDWSDESRAWVGGRYLFQDWFDGASRPLTTDQVEELAELFGIYPEAG